MRPIPEAAAALVRPIAGIRQNWGIAVMIPGCSGRPLDVAAYTLMRGTVREWARHDRVWGDVAEYGTPSVLCGGSNPLYGKTLGYLTEVPGEPMMFFHLWDGTDAESGRSWPPDHAEPLLLAVRYGHAAFADTFTFTPEGRRRRPAPASSPLPQ